MEEPGPRRLPPLLLSFSPPTPPSSSRSDAPHLVGLLAISAAAAAQLYGHCVAHTISFPVFTTQTVGMTIDVNHQKTSSAKLSK